MRILAAAALTLVALAGCTGDASDLADSTPSQSPSASIEASATPTPTMTTQSPTPTVTDEARAVGEAIGTKIVFYAAAKAAGMNDSATMDDLAAGVCSRIDSGAPETVGQWMADTFGLEGDAAASVAVAAIAIQCPEFSSLVGS